MSAPVGLRSRQNPKVNESSEPLASSASSNKQTQAESTSEKQENILYSAFNIIGHIRALFSPRASSLSPLDGWRVLMFLWVMSNHSLFYMLHFISSPNTDYFAANPAHQLMHLGYYAVDGFFILTGFLLSYSVFQEEKKLLKENNSKELNNKVDGSVDTKKKILPASLNSISVYYYRRLARLLPPYYLLVFVYCFIFFPNGLFPFSLVRNENMRNLTLSKMAEPLYQPSNCDATNLVNSFLFIQQLTPFGGCVGYTWSLAIQVLFSLLSPLWYRWLLAYNNSLKRRLFYSSAIVIIISSAFRVFGYFHSRSFPLDEAEGLFVGFYWYSNTFTRMNTFVIGALAAYFSVFTDLNAWSKNNPFTAYALWGLVFITFGLQATWAHLFFDGNNLQTPGNSALSASLLLAPANPVLALNQVWNHIHHLIFHAFILLGSPLSSFIFAFVFVSSIHRITIFGSLLNRLTSFSFWFPLSQLSYFAYLLHPMIFMKEYSIYFSGIVEAFKVESWMVHATYIWNVLLIFFLSFILHIFFEAPLDTLLRKSNNGKGNTVLRNIIFIYCIILLISTFLYHIFATGLMVFVLTPEWIKAQAEATANALNSTLNTTLDA